jgi:hypothetical protein
MKRSARIPHRVFVANIQGSAFSAKKQNAAVVPAKVPGENESEDIVDGEGETPDELSEDDIQFTNSFDVLRRNTTPAPPVPKRVKYKTSLPQLVAVHSTCSNDRVANCQLVIENKSNTSIEIPLKSHFFLMRFLF